MTHNAGRTGGMEKMSSVELKNNKKTV